MLPGGSWRERALTRYLGGQVSRGCWLTFLTKTRLAEDSPEDRAQWGSDPLSLPTAAVTKSHKTQGLQRQSTVSWFWSPEVQNPGVAGLATTEAEGDSAPGLSARRIDGRLLPVSSHRPLSLHVVSKFPFFTRTPVMLDQDPPWCCIFT